MTTTETNQTSDPDEQFGRGLRVAREAQQMTQESLAAAMDAEGHDFHQATIYKIENGKRKVTIGEAYALSRLVGVRLEVLAFEKASGFALAQIEAAARHAIRSVQDVRTHIGRLSDELVEVEFAADALDRTDDGRIGPVARATLARYQPLLDLGNVTYSFMEACDGLSRDHGDLLISLGVLPSDLRRPPVE